MLLFWLEPLDTLRSKLWRIQRAKKVPKWDENKPHVCTKWKIESDLPSVSVWTLNARRDGSVMAWSVKNRSSLYLASKINSLCLLLWLRRAGDALSFIFQPITAADSVSFLLQYIYCFHMLTKCFKVFKPSTCGLHLAHKYWFIKQPDFPKYPHVDNGLNCVMNSNYSDEENSFFLDTRHNTNLIHHFWCWQPRCKNGIWSKALFAV